MSNLSIFGEILRERNAVCLHKKSTKCIQNHESAIRLTEISRLAKLGELRRDFRKCDTCNQRPCQCLWSSVTHEIQIGDEQVKQRAQSQKINFGTNNRNWYIRTSLMDKFRERFRKYTKSRTYVGTSKSMVWIMKPKKSLRFSTTDITSKTTVKPTSGNSFKELGSYVHTDNKIKNISAESSCSTSLNNLRTKEFLSQKYRQLFSPRCIDDRGIHCEKKTSIAILTDNKRNISLTNNYQQKDEICTINKMRETGSRYCKMNYTKNKNTFYYPTLQRKPLPKSYADYQMDYGLMDNDEFSYNFKVPDKEMEIFDEIHKKTGSHSAKTLKVNSYSTSLASKTANQKYFLKEKNIKSEQNSNILLQSDASCTHPSCNEMFAKLPKIKNVDLPISLLVNQEPSKEFFGLIKSKSTLNEKLKKFPMANKEEQISPITITDAELDYFTGSKMEMIKKDVQNMRRHSKPKHTDSTSEKQNKEDENETNKATSVNKPYSIHKNTKERHIDLVSNLIKSNTVAVNVTKNAILNVEKTTSSVNEPQAYMKSPNTIQNLEAIIATKLANKVPNAHNEPIAKLKSGAKLKSKPTNHQTAITTVTGGDYTISFYAPVTLSIGKPYRNILANKKL